MNAALRTTAVALAVLAAAGPASALDREMIWLGTPFMEGWVPEDADAIRGVLILNGLPNDGRFQEACRLWKFAILRINTDGYGSDIPDEPRMAPLAGGRQVRNFAVVHALKRLGELSGHPEINHVPIVATGFSRFSGSAPDFMAAFPDRALCFLNGHGGGADPAASDGRGQLIWRQTPSLGLQSEWENIFEGGDKTKLLNNWWRRPDGNLAAACIHWRVYHKPETFADLGIVFIDEVIKARIPADWDPKKGPARLKPLRHADGWLGSHEGWRVPVEQIFETDNQNAQIAPVGQFKGDPQRASWLVSEELAWAWRAFSSRYPRARIIEPGHSNLVLHDVKLPPPTGHLETGVRAGEPFAAAAVCHLPNMTKLEFFAGTTRLGEATEFTGGQTALGNTLQATGRIQATIDKPGVYGLMARYTASDGTTGWTRPLPLVVWPK